MTDATAPATGTIDITNLVDDLRETWVKWAVAFLYGEEIALPGMQWVALPLISDIDREVITLAMEALSKSALMLAEFTNNAVRKASQAQDFTNAKSALANMDPNDPNYATAEQNEMAAFRNFVMLTN